MRAAFLALSMTLASLPALAQTKDFAIAVNSHGDPVRNRKAGEALIAGCPGFKDNIGSIVGVSVWDKEANGKALPMPLGWSEAIRVVVRTRPDFPIKNARNQSFSFLVGGNDLNGAFTTRSKVAAPLCIMDIARGDGSTYYIKSLPANPLD
jgi:hypothetical protein